MAMFWLGWVLRVVAGSCNIYVSCSNARGLKNCENAKNKKGAYY